MAKARTGPTPGTPARKRRPAASTTRTTKVGQSSRKALAPQGRHPGAFLVLFALVLALGIWFEDGGRLGAFMALLFRGLFGYGAYAVPLLVALAALALFWRPSTKDDMVAGRVTIGLLAVLVGGLGLLHLARAPRRPTRPGGPAGLRGLVGAIIAAPLARLLSSWGAGALFACVLFLGTLISTRTSVAAVARGVTSMGRAAGSALTAPPRPPAPPAPPEVVEPVDSGEAPAACPQAGRAGPRPDPDDTIEVVVGEPDAGAADRRPPPGPRSATRRPPSRPRRPPSPRPTCPGPGTRSSWP